MEQFIIAAGIEKPSEYFIINSVTIMYIPHVVAEKRELKFDDKALHGNMHHHHHQQQQQQHVQKQQPQVLQQQKHAPPQQHHEVKPAEESMGLNLEQFMPQAKPSPQHREADHNMNEEAVLKKLGKGQIIDHHTLSECCVYRQWPVVHYLINTS